jgi:hypothetical protein
MLTPDEYRPVLTKKSLNDPYYNTTEGKAELSNYAMIMSMGLVGGAPAGLGKGVSLVDDIIMRTPVVKDAYRGAATFTKPIVRNVSAELNMLTMPDSVKPVYKIAVRGSSTALDMEPAFTPTLDLSKTTRIPKSSTDIVTDELGKGVNTVFGGGAAGAQYKYTTPRISRDIDAFVNNPELVESRINARITGKSTISSDITDLHGFPDNYPVKGARVNMDVDSKPFYEGVSLGSRLLGDPIPKVPRSRDIVTGGRNNLYYEKLNFLANRKYNALYEDIRGIGDPFESPGEVSRLSNRLGKDALDARSHMTELFMAEKARGGNAAMYNRIMADFDRLYERPVKVRINGVERETTVGQLALEESMKQNSRIAYRNTFDDAVKLNLERSTMPTKSIFSSTRSKVASMLAPAYLSRSLSNMSPSKSGYNMFGSSLPKASSIPNIKPSGISYKPPSRSTIKYPTVNYKFPSGTSYKPPYTQKSYTPPSLRANYRFPSVTPNNKYEFGGGSRSSDTDILKVMGRKDWVNVGIFDDLSFGTAPKKKRKRGGRK